MTIKPGGPIGPGDPLGPGGPTWVCMYWIESIDGPLSPDVCCEVDRPLNHSDKSPDEPGGPGFPGIPWIPDSPWDPFSPLGPDSPWGNKKFKSFDAKKTK